MLKGFLATNKESKIVVMMICIVMVYCHFNLPKYANDGFTREMNWDILSYYFYLPITFLHNDMALKDYSYVQHLFDQYHFSPTFYQASQAENGNYVMMYTMGLAMLQLPFFLIGHLWAKLGGYPLDGFSMPYQFCVSTGMFLYGLAGIFILRKILLHFFQDRTVAISMILLLLGTNYFREIVDYNLGPHATLFAIYCVLIWNTIKWHGEQKTKYAIAMGFTIGFLTLSRPTELICVLIPLLWGVYNKQTLREKWQLVMRNKKQLLILMACVVLVGIPQMLYWKHLTGSFYYNSYWNQQTFDITESHLTKILFSWRKGWFVYSPLIVLAFAGFLLLWKEKLKVTPVAVYVFIFINIFLICHVPIWWNAGSFGQRFMVQSYALLSIPFTASIAYIMEKKFLLRMALGGVAFLLVCLNLFQTWQFVNWILPGDGITKEFYFATFLRRQPLGPEESKLLELQRSNDPTEKFNNDGSYIGRTIGFYNFDDVNTGHIETYYLDTIAHSGRYSYRSSIEGMYSPGVVIPYSQITKKDHAWIRFTLWYYPTLPMEESKADIVIHFTHRDKPYSYAGYHLFDQPTELNKWNKITVDYLTPAVFSEEDELHAYVWFTGTKMVYIDDMQIEAYEKR